MYPANFHYTKDHEWIDVKDGIGTVGITYHAQEELGDVVFVELPKVGVQLKAGESFGSIESVKAVSDIFAPVSGEVVDINSALVDTPERVNSDPHGGAWLIKIRLKDASETASLIDAAAYQSYIAQAAKGIAH
jgi:glycine cleavage system H protein